MGSDLAGPVATLLLVILAAAPIPVAASSGCSMTVTLTPGERVADITGTQPAAVQFAGSVSLSKPPGPDVLVSIIASVTTGWAGIISPNSLSTGPAADFEGIFNATVVVPAGTLATEIGQLTVTARAFLGSESCAMAQAQAIVTPAAYFGPLHLSVPDERVTADEIGHATLPATVWTDGNVRDQASLQFQVDGPPGLAHNRTAAVAVTLEPGPAGAVSVTVGLDCTAVAPGEYRVTVAISPDASDTFVLVVPDRSSAAVGLAVAVGAAAAAAVAAAVIWLRSRSP